MADLDPDAVATVRTMLRGGRAAEAARLLRRMLETDPTRPDLLQLRARAALQSGDLVSARDDLEAARTRAPDDPDVLRVLAGICHAQDEDETAEAYLETALSRAPERADVWYSLGLVRHAAGRYQAALDAYDRALAIAPTLGPAIVGRGKIYQLLGDLDAASQAFREVLHEDPNNAEATGALAAQMQIRGDYEAGLTLIEALAARQRLDTDLSLVRARLLRGVGRIPEALASLESLESDRLTTSERCHLSYALGELHDQLGRHDAAFRHFTRANRLKPGGFDRQRHRHTIEATREAWSRAALDRLSGIGDLSASPVFIVGMPRSGTTLVEQMLAAHPDVHGAGELMLIGDLARAWRGPADVLLPGMIEPALVLPGAARYLAQANPAGSPRFTDKMPANFAYLGFIQALLPNARIIHCRRHPLDTALSCFCQDFSGMGLAWSNRLEDIATFYGSYRALMGHWRGVLSLPIFDLCYEQLVEDPEATLRPLCAFLDLSWQPECLAHHRTDRVSVTASHEQARRPVYRHAVGRHRAYRDYLMPLESLMEDIDGR